MRPVETLEYPNQTLAGIFPAGKFVTVLYSVLDAQSRSAQTASCQTCDCFASTKIGLNREF